MMEGGVFDCPTLEASLSLEPNDEELALFEMPKGGLGMESAGSIGIMVLDWERDMLSAVSLKLIELVSREGILSLARRDALLVRKEAEEDVKGRGDK